MNQDALLVELHKAAEHGDLENLRKCIAAGADVNACHGVTPLVRAASQGHVAIVNLLLDSGAAIALAPGFSPAVVCAAVGGHSEVVGLLLKRGATPNPELLSLASLSGWLAIVKRCLAAGLDVNQRDNYGGFAIHWACVSAKVEMVDFLLKAGARTELRLEGDNTALHCACGARVFPPRSRLPKDDLCGTVRLLLKHGADPNARTADGTTPLMLAADLPKSPAARVCRMLLQAGAAPDLQNAEGVAALHLAAGAGNSAMLKMLLSAGCNPNHRDQRGLTPLLFMLHDPREDMEPPMVLSRKPNPRILDLLHQFGADVNATDQKSRSPLHLAFGKSPSLARKLFRFGAEPQAVDQEGFTVLMAAAGARHLPSIRHLLELGLDINAQTHSGHTALKAAIAARWPGSHVDAPAEIARLVRFLLQRGASVHLPATGEPPLHSAIRRSLYETTRLILAAGADPEAVDDRGLTAIQVLVSRRSDKSSRRLLELLLSRKADLNRRFELGPKGFGAIAPMRGGNFLDRGASALELALAAGWDRDTIQKLLANGAAFEGSEPHVPLFLALTGKDPDVIKLILERNPDLSARDKAGRTALHYAADQWCHEEVVSLLIKAGAKVDTRDNEGKTPLHYAAPTINADVVRVLLENGADPNAKANDGRTPKQLAWRSTRMLFP